MEVTYLESNYYMVRLGRELTTSISLRTERLNNKQKSSFAITNITYQYFRNLMKKFKNPTYLGLKSKHVHNEPTEAYF